MSPGALMFRSSMVCLLMALSMARGASADSARVDLSPGPAGQLFAMPGSMWSNINQFAFLVCLDQPGVKATLNDRLSKLNGYNALHSSCQVWGTSTFDKLQRLATQLASGEMKQALLRLQDAYRNLPGSRAEFDQAADSVNRQLATLSELSGEVNQQSLAFHNSSEIVIGQYRKNNPPDESWVNIGPKMDDVGGALGAMVGRWNMLTANLAYLRKKVALPAGNSGVPELYDLDIEVGLNAWDEIAQRARQFLADMPAQNRNLSGANYYDNCPMDEGKWYAMTNLFLSGKGYILTAQRMGGVGSVPQHGARTFMKSPGQNTNNGNYNEALSQQWRFHRYGKGWWGIESGIRNDTGRPAIFLLGSNVEVDRVMQGQGAAVSQNYWWRCLKTENNGWFRLTNATLGDLRLLDVFNNPENFFPGFMGTSKLNYSGQFWKLELSANP